MGLALSHELFDSQVTAYGYIFIPLIRRASLGTLISDCSVSYAMNKLSLMLRARYLGKVDCFRRKVSSNLGESMRSRVCLTSYDAAIT